MRTLTQHFTASVVAVAMLGTTLPMQALAGPIDTEQAARTAQQAAAQSSPSSAAQAREQLARALNRDDVQQQLVQRGVDVNQARARIDALSDAEASELARIMDQAPAGAGILGTIVFIFVLLLVTDILGLTKVFPFTRSVR